MVSGIPQSIRFKTYKNIYSISIMLTVECTARQPGDYIDFDELSTLFIVSLIYFINVNFVPPVLSCTIFWKRNGLLP